MTDDDHFMHAALAIGRRGLGRTAPNPSVGCVIVRDGLVVGRGVTQPGGRPHAETVALSAAGVAARGATAYVTLEPCSHVGRTGPCADALARAGIVRVVGAIRDPDPRVAGHGFAMLRSFGLAVTEGVLAEEARRSHVGHFTRIALGRPAVTLKLALSADGKVAGPGGAPLRITGEDADRQVHMLRVSHDAIAVGVGTVLVDDPRLTIRLPGLEGHVLPRIIFDSTLRTPPSARLVATAANVPTTIIAAEDAPAEQELRLTEHGVVVLRVARGSDGRLDPGEALRLLGTLGLTRLFVEGGPTLAAALIEADLVDRAVFFTSPRPIGPCGIPGITDGRRRRLERTLPNLAKRTVGSDQMTDQTRD